MLCLLYFLPFGWSQSANTQINGSLVDRYNQAKVEASMVICIQNGNRQWTISDFSGSFSFTIQSNSAYTLVVTHLGYETYQQSFDPSEKAPVILLQPSTEMIEAAIVSAIRSKRDMPTTVTNLSKAAIDKSNFGQDLPALINLTPSAVMSSDAGAGVGYTGIRIRGIDQNRINVTINGIPLNDAESHGVYWVDLPDFASSAQSIQIQRGVGTSTNGSASFGASINVKTDHLRDTGFAAADVSLGSFQTSKITALFGTGVLKNNWGVQGRLSQIKSDGFIDRASSDLRSLFLTTAHYGEKDLLKLNVMLGHERTYQAWYGVPQVRFNQNEEATLNFMDELYFSQEQRDHLLQSNHNTYNPYTYKNEVDNYDQHHFQLFYNRRLKSKVMVQGGLHYTHGFGYYEQWRPNDDFHLYGLPQLYIGSDTLTSGDFVRRRWLDNHFYGGIFSAEINSGKTNHLFGGGVHQYQGRHFGEIVWAEFGSGVKPQQLYYDFDADKSDGNLYWKVVHSFRSLLKGYADLQVRYVNYGFEIPGSLQFKSDEASFVFFNPKFGFTYRTALNDMFNIFFGASSREPVRDDFLNKTANYTPIPEKLYNMEVGHEWNRPKWVARLTGYGMYYHDQLVLTGAINDVGAYVRTNVPQSYRAGIETEASAHLKKHWSLSGNLTLSRNKVFRFDEYVDDWFTGEQVVNELSNTDLSFSPALIGTMAVNYSAKRISAQVNTKRVGKQYLDNSQSEDRVLEGFSVVNLQIDYQSSQTGTIQWHLGFQVNNMLNALYAPNGYTFGTMDTGKRRSYNYVYPMAGRHFMLRFKVEV